MARGFLVCFFARELLARGDQRRATFDDYHERHEYRKKSVYGDGSRPLRDNYRRGSPQVVFGVGDNVVN